MTTPLITNFSNAHYTAQSPTNGPELVSLSQRIIQETEPGEVTPPIPPDEVAPPDQNLEKFMELLLEKSPPPTTAQEIIDIMRGMKTDDGKLVFDTFESQLMVLINSMNSLEKNGDPLAGVVKSAYMQMYNVQFFMTDFTNNAIANENKLEEVDEY